jgi:two-component system C4-dicarboxylate transport sensor histidine kinase DctB
MVGLSRRLTVASLVIGLVGILLFVVVQHQTLSYQVDQTLGRGRTTLRLAASALDGRLNRYRALPGLIAGESLVRELFVEPGDTARQQQANVYLSKISTLLGSSDIYMMGLDGTTIAASNYADPDSFVGQNFSFRPYFQEALVGGDGHFFALGTTSDKRGYYFSAPVVDNGKVAGVVVFKIDLDQVEASWQGNAEYEIVVVDPQGIIFLTSRKDWLYGSFGPLSASDLAVTRQSRRYADSPLSQLPVHRLVKRDGYQLLDIDVDGAERDYAALSQPMVTAGWTVEVLVDTRAAYAQALTDAIGAVVVLGFFVLAGAIALRERSRLGERIRVHREARAELEERVRLRTMDLALANVRLEEEVGERRDAEEQLRKTQSDLVQAGKLAALGQMSAALSHEFNQPLAALAVYADTAATYLDRNRIAEARENVSRMASLVERLSRISRHLRSFARKPEEKLRPTAISEVADEVTGLLAPRIAAAEATIEVAIDPDAGVVMAGTVRLQQVLLNLVSNALDVVEELDDRRITISSRPLGESRVEIAVRDRGPGVPAALGERIFDPFFTTKGPGKGLGLGLSISYNIVKDFGGLLTVRQHEEGGAMFIIELDRARIEEPAVV